MSSINMTTQVTPTTTIQDQRRRLCVQNEITNDLYYGIVRTDEQRTTGEPPTYLASSLSVLLPKRARSCSGLSFHLYVCVWIHSVSSWVVDKVRRRERRERCRAVPCLRKFHVSRASRTGGNPHRPHTMCQFQIW